MQDPLKLGFFIQPVHPPFRAYADVLREDREAVVLADRLGYREAFIGEHLVDAAETITSSLAFIASLADACPSITFGTGVLPLANYHPAMAAAQVAMVDHLVHGRLVLGVGPGVSGDAEAIGDLGSDRNRKTQEALDHMCRIWSEEPPYRIEGEFYRTTTERSLDRSIGVGVAVRPLQRPHPPIAITSIRPDSRGPHMAGARGWTGISATYVGAYVIRAQIQSFVEGRRSAGRSADPSGWRVARSIFVADDEATARRYAHREDGAHGFYFHVMRTKLTRARALDVMRDFPNQPDSELSPRRCIERLVIAGTPESVADQILAFRNEVGAFGTLLYTGHDWTDPALARRSMELMANEVWPRIDRAVHGTTPQTGGTIYSERRKQRMAAKQPEWQVAKPKKAVVQWLLDSDPSIRWQVMRDLTEAPDELVAAERSRIASEGWGARLLDLQGPDGSWGGATSTPKWASTLYPLLLLRNMGLDQTSQRARTAVGLVRDKFTWGPEFGDGPFFEGEVEPCINGGVLALGGYFGETSDRLLDRLLGEQLEDGGWNCEAERGSVRSSFHTTICVLEGLLEYEKAKGATAAVTAARVRAQEYLLERRMFRRLSSGEVIDRNWTRFSFPTTWHYDVLRGLDYLRSAGVEPGERLAEAVGLVAKRRHQNGRWPLHDPHPDPVNFDMEGGAGKPSRWNTLRASRVLDWYSAQG